jgi:hypothetical protein
VLLKMVYLLTCRVLGVAALVFRGDQAKAAELLVPRHENAALRRHVSRVRYEPADRAWSAALARLVPRSRWTQILPVTPATLLAGNRKLAAAKYDTSRRRKPGRPPAARSITRLVPAGDGEPVARISPDPRRAGKPGPAAAPSKCGESCLRQASTRRPAARARPGGSSSTPRPPRSSRPTSCT